MGKDDLIAHYQLTCNCALFFSPSLFTMGRSGTGQKKYKWSTSLDTVFKFDFDASVPVEDIAAIDWHNSVKGVEKSDAGSEVSTV